MCIKRELIRSFELRHYPKNSSWIKTATVKKTKAFSKAPTKSPILYVDVNLGFARERVLIYEGETADDIAQTLSKKYCISSPPYILI